MLEKAKTLRNTERWIIALGILSFIVAPLVCWGVMMASDESPLFASLSRLIWVKGLWSKIFRALLLVFIPMIISFFKTLALGNYSRKHRIVCKSCLLASLVCLFVGTMIFNPGDGMKPQNLSGVMHAALSGMGLGGIFVTYCIITIIMRRTGNLDGSFILSMFLPFVLITSLFAIFNIIDEGSYVGASAVAESYMLIVFNVLGWLAYYFTYLKAKITLKENTV